MTCGGRSWAGPERGSEILCVLTHGMGSTPPHQDKVLQQFTNNELLRHFTALENEFDRYFPELSDDELKLVRNPFKFSVEKVHDHCLE